jgi:hypothetical protein
MGGHALRGERAQALKALARAEKELGKAKKIPGFERLAGAGVKLAGAQPGQGGALGPAALAGGAMPGAGMPAQAAAALQSLPPRLQNRLRALGLRLAQAYQQGLDVASLQPLLQELGEAVQKGQTARVGQLIQRLEAALNTLRPRPPGGGGPSLPGRPPALPSLPGLPAGPSPFLPPRGPTPGMATPDLTPTILAALDRIRAMPAEEYKKQRPFIAQMIGQLLQGAATSTTPLSPPMPGEGARNPQSAIRNPQSAIRPVPDRQRPAKLSARMALTTATGFTLELSAVGRVTSVRIGDGRQEGVALPLREDALSGFVLERAQGAPLPLTGLVESRGDQIRQRVDEPTAQVQLSAVYATDENGLMIRARLTSLADGPRQVRLSYRFPLDAVGWLWTATPSAGGGKPVEIVAGQVYQVTRTGTNVPDYKPRTGTNVPDYKRATLSGQAGVLHVETSTLAAELVYDATARVLSITFPLSFQPTKKNPRPAAEVTFRLNATAPSPEPAAPGFPPFPPADER